MKQIGSISRLAGVFALFALAANLSLSAAEVGKADITAIKGSVKVDAQEVKVGDSIAPGQQIETGADSQLNLFLGANGPTLVVSADSRLAFDELSADTAGAEPVISTKINVKSGKVSGYVKKTSSQSKYVVQTPTMTAAIRGTQYLVDSDAGVVYVWEGVVTVSWRGNNYEVSAGQKFDSSVGAVVANDLPNPFRLAAGAGNATFNVPVIYLRPNPVAPGTSTTQPGTQGAR
jgi:hypothetical protein